jgi:hypothetical protein
MMLLGPSIRREIIVKETNMIGVKRKRVEKGLEVPGWRRRRIWVRPHRNPEKKAEAITSANPNALKSGSPATIITTPTIIVQMMRISLRDGVSRRKRKANKSTKPKAEDLHMVRNDRVMNLRDIFPSPMSNDVAQPHGTSLVR